MSPECLCEVSCVFEIPHRSFLISFWKCLVWVEAETHCSFSRFLGWLMHLVKKKNIQKSILAQMSFICHIHNYTEYNQQWNVFSAFNPSKCTHTWSSGQPTLRCPGSSFGGSVPCSTVSPQSWTIPARAEIRTHNLRLQVRQLYPLEPRLPLYLIIALVPDYSTYKGDKSDVHVMSSFRFQLIRHAFWLLKCNLEKNKMHFTGPENNNNI